jgi:hypothetical protein
VEAHIDQIKADYAALFCCPSRFGKTEGRMDDIVIQAIRGVFGQENTSGPLL